MDLARELKTLQRKWGNAESRVAGSPIPDGEYVGKIDSMTINRSKKGEGRLQVATKFEIVGGKKDGTTISRYDGIEDEEQMGYFKGYCEVLGITIPEDLQELPEELDTFVNDCQDLFQLNVATKNNFQNINIVGVSEDGGEEGGDGEEAETEDEAEERIAEEERKARAVKKKKDQAKKKKSRR